MRSLQKGPNGMIRMGMAMATTQPLPNNPTLAQPFRAPLQKIDTAALIPMPMDGLMTEIGLQTTLISGRMPTAMAMATTTYLTSMNTNST